MKNKKSCCQTKAELMKENNELIEENNGLTKQNNNLQEKVKTLQDEVDSLWAMMDEITKSDIENFSHLLEELKSDVLSRTLMITKNVAKA